MFVLDGAGLEDIEGAFDAFFVFAGIANPLSEMRRPSRRGGVLFVVADVAVLFHVIWPLVTGMREESLW